ncbi:aminotransferase class V-fold PLP-dependent enzyme [Gordonia shandongensis]|uniref:aminotransferase class V-fold PLP-dependent enzyme n=1 Tax=Gordonia shandongensis TaxID=376351 RepID=UPI0003F5AA19|nr:aminotransferase class V-fold PLP-dependent enzyme [Gordonia shandongensis]
MYCSELGDRWHGARIEPSIGHLDAASAARSSNAVIDTLHRHLLREAERGSYVAADEIAADLTDGRRALGSLIGHLPEEIAFRDSARAALRAVLNAWNLPLSPTVWVAKNEFGPNLTEFEDRDFAVRTMPESDVYGHVDVDSVENMLQFEQPDFIHVCHIGSASGIVQPVAEIVRVAHDAGVPVVVDMAQSVGHVPTVTGADIVYGTARKWLSGPRGVGFVAVRPDSLARVDVLSSESFIAGQLALSTAVGEIVDIGQQRVYRELAEIGRMTRERLNGIGSWEVMEPVSEPSALVTLAPPPGFQESDVLAAKNRLLAGGLLVTAADSWRAPLAGEQSLLRVSPHLDATREQLDQLATDLRVMGY